MPQRRRRSRIILGLLALGLLAGAAFTAHPAQAVEAPGPYYAKPAWDRKMAAANRFVVLTNWANAAVLDKETGLVWERTPSDFGFFNWNQARVHCTDLTIGGRKGWRLPSIHELQSLVQPDQDNPALPPGHPFLLGLAAFYWSATTLAERPTDAWDVFINTGGVHTNEKTLGDHAWCVRGGLRAEVY